MMETPPNARVRPQRTPTPKMSERKRSLFTNGKQSPINEELNNTVIDGIRPFSPEANKIILEDSSRKSGRIKSKRRLKDEIDKIKKVESSNAKKASTISKTPDSDNKRTSPRRAVGNKSLSTDIGNILNAGSTGKENLPVTPKKKSSTTDELFTLFDNALNLKSVKKSSALQAKEDLLTSLNKSPTNSPDKSAQRRKRNKEICEGSPQCKISKITSPDKKHSPKVSSISEIHIPTKSFYSNGGATKTSPHFSLPKISPNNEGKKIKKYTKLPKTNSNINKGVRHKIKRQRKSLNPESIEDILKSINCEKFKFLPSKRVFNEQVAEVHKVLKTCSNSIEMARPLRVEPEMDEVSHFSDSSDESYSESNVTETIIEPIQETNNNLSNSNVKKKFFKSGGHTIKNQFKITNKIRATVTNGKLSILPTHKKKPRYSKSKGLDVTFSTEQAKVNEIIEKLELTQDISALDLPGQHDEPNLNIAETENTLPEPLVDDEMFANFRERLPYGTTDPEKIEQQHLLLDFLITNQICTEKNFNIFIADPENHKEEAARIVDSLVAIVSDKDEMDIEGSRSNDKYENIEGNREEAEKLLDTFLALDEIETEEMIVDYRDINKHFSEMELEAINLDINNAETSSTCDNLDYQCTPEKNSSACTTKNGVSTDQDQRKLFPVFYPEKYKLIQQKSLRRHQPNFLNRGSGLNQYQIDAGQKEFGAKQCSQCGLVYTAHEPEEERIHNEYHNSLHILKFKGWIDEDVVAEYPEWGPDGRIIRVSNFSHSKRSERVKEVLKIVDKELGFSSYCLPETYVAFLAIRRNQIVGFCLVQPLKEAHRFICMDGVDCCTNETFTAKCGISRIWVSPFHRRMRIGSKLLKAVQFNTLLGVEITMDEIAFSAPTHDGMVFAQMVSKRKDFLVYQ